MGNGSGAKVLRDVLEIRDDVHSGNFKVELAAGVADEATTRQLIDEYVVTDQLRKAFTDALNLVKAAYTTRTSHAAYLHGSFGSGKSHFLTVLHAVLNNDTDARAKPGLQPVIADHDSWLRGRSFLMVPYHLVGATDITSALLSGYVRTVGEKHPKAPTPAVYRDQQLMADARRQREFLGDDALFAQWLDGGSRQNPAVAAGQAAPEDDLEPIDAPAPGAAAQSWPSADLDTALDERTPPGDPARTRLVQALLDGPLSSYKSAVHGANGGFISLDDGLSAISHHAQGLGYDGIVLFLDELILWLQAHLGERTFINTQVQLLVKLIESANNDRPVPIVAFVSRQRNLSVLIGEDIVGADVKNLEAQANYLAERFDVIELEDRNLPAIIRERVLRRRPGADSAIDAAFDAVETAGAKDRDILLDAHGATQADWNDFRSVYPLTPALLNTLVAISGALQRERTGLKLVHELLRNNAETPVGNPIPVGELWDVLTARTGAPFTDRLKTEAERAQKLHAEVLRTLQERYQGDPDDSRLRQDDLLIKTLLLSALAPDVPALRQLTGGKLAALNYGVLTSRLTSAGSAAVKRMRELSAEFSGQIRSDGDQADPVFTVHLSDLDVKPLLDACDDADRPGSRRIWVKNLLWDALGVPLDQTADAEQRTIIWQGTQRRVEFVFGNVRDAHSLTSGRFEPDTAGHVKIVIDYPFDEPDHSPNDDKARVEAMVRGGLSAPTVVWLPDFLSVSCTNLLGRLLRTESLLRGNRLEEVASHISAEDRLRVRQQLQVSAANLTQQLTEAILQAYGLVKGEERNIGSTVTDGEHLLSLLPGHRPVLRRSEGFEKAMLRIAEDLYTALYPGHLNLDLQNKGDLVTLRDLKTVQSLVAAAVEDGSMRTVVDSGKLPLAQRVVHGLQLGEVHDGPLNVSTEWRRRFDQQAAKAGIDPGADLKVEQLRAWLEELGFTGLDDYAANLIIACYAMVADKTWVYHQSPVAAVPALDAIGRGYALRSQELPDESQYTAACAKAAGVFGLRLPPVRNARNTAHLAAEIRAQVLRYERTVKNLLDSLHADTHATLLGLEAGNARVVSVTEAAELLAKLSRHHDRDSDTALVRELAGHTYPISDQIMGNTIKSAQDVLAALDGTEWPVVRMVREMAERADDIGEQARSLVGRLSKAANSEEFVASLPEALAGTYSRGMVLLGESQRRAAVAVERVAPGAAPGGPAEPDPAPRTAGEVPLPVDEQDPTPRGAKRARSASMLESITRDVLAEASAYASRHPEAVIEITWRPVSDEEGA